MIVADGQVERVDSLPLLQKLLFLFLQLFFGHLRFRFDIGVSSISLLLLRLLPIGKNLIGGGDHAASQTGVLLKGGEQSKRIDIHPERHDDAHQQRNHLRIPRKQISHGTTKFLVSV